MKKLLVTIILLITLVSSAFARTTKVGEKLYFIKNSDEGFLYEVISEKEAELISHILNTFTAPFIDHNCINIDPEVASLVKNFGYVLYHDNMCVIIYMYNKYVDCIDIFAWD